MTRFLYNFTANSTYNHTYPEGYHRGLCRLQNDTEVYVYATVLILLAIISTFENLIVIIVICKNKVLQTPSIILLGILAMIDLITGCVVTPIKVVLTLRWTSYRFIQAFLWIFAAVVFFSLSTVLMISIDRFFHVYLLNRYNLTMKKLILGLSVCWAIPLLITFCLAAGHYFYGLHWVLVVFFLFCIVAMIVAYLGMIVTLKKHTLNTNDETRQAYIKDQKKAVKTTLTIICTCLVMNIPPVLSIALVFMGTYFSGLCAITFFTLLANSAINPVIYCLRMPVMRKHVCQLLGMRSRENNDESENVFLSVVADTNI